MTAPAALSLYEASALIAAGELSPLELARSVLDRIERFDPRLKSYVSVFCEEALFDAREETARIAVSGQIGPLHGVPLAIKDIFDMRGEPTLAGSRVREGHRASADSAAVARLREAGAILVGKTVTHEFACGVTSPPARNPWDTSRSPGGSSGGSGAAVSADLCAAATGTDTAGSVRIPASACGVVGIKPTFGRVSKRGVVPLARSLDHVGVLAKTVLDAALVLDAIAGYDPEDSASLNEPAPDLADGLEAGAGGLRVGLARNWFPEHVEPFVAQAVEEAARVFESLGFPVEEAEVPDLDAAGRLHATILAAEAGSYHSATLRDRSDLYGRGTRRFLEHAQTVSASEYLDAQRAREKVRRDICSAFDRFDVLLAPTLPTTAAPFGSRKVRLRGEDEEITAAYIRLCAPANLAGLPALSVPCGHHQGLPMGLQILGRPLDERSVLRAGHLYEQATEHHLRRPDLPA